jgi:tetratricopeptide (TPR) repeat protein
MLHAAHLLYQSVQLFQEGIKNLHQWYQENGYVLAQVINFSQAAEDGRVILEVAEGVIEEIQIHFLSKDRAAVDAQGDLIRGKTPTSLIFQEIESKPGSVFNKAIVQEDMQRVFSLDRFEDVWLSLTPGQDPRQVIVVVNVIEWAESEADIALKAGLALEAQRTTESYQQAIVKYQKALQGYRSAKNKLGEAFALNNLGNTFNLLNAYQPTLDYYSQALSVFQELNAPLFQALVLNNIGSAFRSLNQKEQALYFYQQALPIWDNLTDTLTLFSNPYNDCQSNQSTDKGTGSIWFDFYHKDGERRLKVTLQCSIGKLPTQDSPIDQWLESTPFHDTLLGKAIALFNIGDLYRLLGNYEQALESLHTVLPLWSVIRSRLNKSNDFFQTLNIFYQWFEAFTLIAIGFVHLDLDMKESALDFFRRAKQMMHFEEEEYKQFQPIVDNLAELLFNLGDTKQAFDLFRQIIKSLPLSKEELVNIEPFLNIFDSLISTLGEERQSLDLFEKIMNLVSKGGEELKQLQPFIQTLSSFINNCSDGQKAIELFKQIMLMISDEVEEFKELKSCINLLTDYFSNPREQQQVVNILNQMLPLWQAIGENRGEAATYTLIGNAYTDSCEYQQALDSYHQALQIWQNLGDRYGEANTLTAIAKVLFNTGNEQQALEFYEQAQLLWEAIGYSSGEANTLHPEFYSYE